jgi:isopenicillin-N N-acyltransferase-like protein
LGANSRFQSPLISVSGDPGARGVKLGTQAKEMITRNVEYYMHLWKTYLNLDRDSVIRESAKFSSVIQEYDRDLLDEMKGIADGSQVLFEEIIALNCRYELVWGRLGDTRKSAHTASVSVPECTSIGATAEATKNGHTFVAGNWDYKPKVRENCIILEEIQEPTKPNIVIHTEAGIIGQKGMNSEGIGVVANALMCDQDKYEAKTPFFLTLRGALNQRTLDRALLAVTSTDRAVSGNLMIGQEGGDIVDLECSPEDVQFLFAKDGVLSHANNFTSSTHLVDKSKYVWPDSFIRTERAERLLRKRVGDIEVETMEETLKDHFSYPNSICGHPDPHYPVDFQTESLTSTVMDLESRVIHMTDGQPCSNPYKTFEFESLRSKHTN